jgi:hypothetical protein
MRLLIFNFMDKSNVHNMAKYISDDDDLMQKRQPTDQTYLKTYLEYFEDVEADAMQYAIFS